ncbi:MAG: large conductance mechanosensitive channel protein MscL [Lachnospiraceae bacterium]|nr:large conductance mechanosensitive channel protein MscL [Lachnospiraceae bacterium]
MSKGKGFINEFKQFIMRGNVMDMAVGVIIGGAFTAIVTSLNQDILTPILGIFGGVDFSNLFVQLTGRGTLYTTLAQAQEAGVAVLAYGNFITAIINFLITAFVIFCLIKGINAANDKLSKKKEEAPAAPTTKICPFCKSEISIEATRCPHCTSQLEAGK